MLCFSVCSSAPLAHQKLQTKTLLHILLQIQTEASTKFEALALHRQVTEIEVLSQRNQT